jgi:MFS family permease
MTGPVRWIDNWRATPPRGTPPRPHWQLALVAGMAAGLYTLVGLLVPLWAVTLGAAPAQVGLLVGAGAVLPMLLAVPAGASVARLGAPRLLVLAALLALVGTLAIPFERDLTRLVLLQLVGGLGRAIAWMAAQTYLVQLGGGPDGARRAVVFSCASMVGTLLSPFVVGLVVGGWGYEAAFGVAAVAYALLALGGARLPTPAAKAQAPLAPHSSATAEAAIPLALHPTATESPFAPGPPPPGRARLLASRSAMLVLLGTFLRFACGTLRLTFFPLFLAGLGYAPLAIGLLVGLGNLVSVGGAPLARPLLGRLGSLRLLYVALCVGLTALALTPLGTAALPIVGLAALWGLGMGLSLPALLQQIADGTRSRGPRPGDRPAPDGQRGGRPDHPRRPGSGERAARHRGRLLRGWRRASAARPRRPRLGRRAAARGARPPPAAPVAGDPRGGTASLRRTARPAPPTGPRRAAGPSR